MKLYYLVITILIYTTTFAQKQPKPLKVPYQESFEKFKKPKKKHMSLQVNKGRWETTKNTASVFNTDKNANPIGKSLQLTVKKNDWRFAMDKTEDKSRTEIVVKTNHKEGTTYYYSWKVFIPNNNEFKDEDSNTKNEGSYHHIAQLFPSSNDPDTNCIINSPLMGLTFFHNTKSKDNFRKVKFMFQYQNSNECENSKKLIKRLEIEKAIEKGKWTEIIMKVNWSTDSKTGYMEFWFNRKPLKIVEKDKWVDNGTLINTNKKPTKYYFANMFKYNKKYNYKGIPNYLKLGHYRKHLNNTHIIYIDNISVTKEMPLLWNQVAFLPNQCNGKKKIKVAKNKLIKKYKYLIKYKTNIVTEYLSKKSKLKIKKIKGLQKNKKYNLEVIPIFENNIMGIASTKKCTFTAR